MGAALRTRQAKKRVLPGDETADAVVGFSAYSGRIRSPIPTASDRLFRSIRSVIPTIRSPVPTT
jgi:hypothetical protein